MGPKIGQPLDRSYQPCRLCTVDKQKERVQTKFREARYIISDVLWSVGDEFLVRQESKSTKRTRWMDHY
jgi:hypothetical protein